MILCNFIPFTMILFENNFIFTVLLCKDFILNASLKKGFILKVFLKFVSMIVSMEKA